MFWFHFLPLPLALLSFSFLYLQADNFHKVTSLSCRLLKTAEALENYVLWRLLVCLSFGLISLLCVFFKQQEHKLRSKMTTRCVWWLKVLQEKTKIIIIIIIKSYNIVSFKIHLLVQSGREEKEEWDKTWISHIHNRECRFVSKDLRNHFSLKAIQRRTRKKTLNSFFSSLSPHALCRDRMSIKLISFLFNITSRFVLYIKTTEWTKKKARVAAIFFPSSFASSKSWKSSQD